MNEPRRFDPIGWFASASLTVFLGMVALAAAVHIARDIWVWLAVVVMLLGLVALLVWWHRRQPW